MNTADVVIIGGGIAGASLAYRLAGRCRTVLLEAEPHPGYHATGRSAALFTGCYGKEPVRALADASRDFLLHPPAALGASALATRRGVLWIAREDQAARLADFRAQLSATRAGLQDCTPDTAQRLCPALRSGYAAAAALEPEAFDIDVHALLQAFLRVFRRASGSLVTSAPVVGLRRVGACWHVEAASEHYECPVVVNAAGAWADEIAALAGVLPIGLAPKRRTAITFDIQGVDAAQVSLGQWPCVIDVDETFYFKPDAGRVLASPGDETLSAPGDVQAEDFDIAVAVDRIETATTLQVGRVAARWAGLRSFVADGLPVVGMDPEAQGFFWLAAQGGYGIMTSPAVSALAAGLIAGDRSGDPDLANIVAPRRPPRGTLAARKPA